MALLPARNILDGTKSPATTTSDMKTALGTIRDYLSDIGGTDSSIPTGQGTYGSRGLVGKVNASTPLTKYDISADAVILRNLAGTTITQYGVTSITCDLGLVGPAANGRDQSAVFSVSNWVYVYFIWNGVAMATLASLTAPPTGPTLPTGYTHWCFATALKWNASSNIIPCRTQGSYVWYDLATAGVNRAVSGGQATTMSALGISSLVPPNCTKVSLNLSLDVIHNAAGVGFIGTLRPTGATSAGQDYIKAVVQVASVEAVGQTQCEIVLGTSQSIDYKINSVPSASGGLAVDVLGFYVPNGAS